MGRKLFATLLLTGATVPAGAIEAPTMHRATDVAAAAIRPTGEVPVHDRTFWRRIAATDGTVPEAEPVAVLVDELEAYLQSPDPELRDTFGYSILTKWIHTGDTLPRGRVVALAAELRQQLARGIGETDTDSVFGRSFAALLLASIVAADASDSFLPDDELAAILDSACRYAREERDLRGWVDDKGWAHAAAHTADLLKWLARSPRVGPDDLARLLSAVTDLVIRPHGVILAYGEDGRLAAIVTAVAGRGSLAESSWAAWVARLRETLNRDPQPTLDRLDVLVFAAQRNVRNLAYSVYVHLDALPNQPDQGPMVKELVRRLILGQ